MLTHADYKYSITVHATDLPVVCCLRALSKFSQKHGNVNIVWGGTKDSDWERDHHRITFHFSSPEYRDIFVSEAKRLFPRALWREVKRSDSDPATPQLRY